MNRRRVNKGEIMLLIPAAIVDAAAEEGKLARRRPAEQVLTNWILMGRDAERQAVGAKRIRQLGDRVAGLVCGRQRAVLVSGDLATAVAGPRNTIGCGRLTVWAVLGAIIETAVSVRRIRRDSGGRRRVQVRILDDRSNNALAWQARCLIGIHSMAVDEDYRKEIAKRLS